MSTNGETGVITPELYKAIITAIDERINGIRVTRADFSELRAIITELASAQRELAQAQARTEVRIERLEDVVERLARAQGRTEEALKELASQVGKLSDNMWANEWKKE